MYSFIRGQLRAAFLTHIVVEAGGIGYKVFIPASAYHELPQIETECLVYVSHVVRELSISLYGFLSIPERDLFDTMLNVSGIGPKTALSLIGHLGPGALHTAVQCEDIATLSKVPGIGKKTAERLVIELRDKSSFTQEIKALQVNIDPKKTKLSDALNALINLGYNPIVAQKALKKTLQTVPEESDLSLLITSALKNV